MNPKQLAKRNTVLRVIAFLLIVALVYGALTRLLTVNNATSSSTSAASIWSRKTRSTS